MIGVGNLSIRMALLCLLPLSAAAGQAELARLRVLSEKTFHVIRPVDSNETHIRFSPSVALENRSEIPVVVPEDRTEAAVFVKVRILDANGQDVRVRKCEDRSPDQSEVELVEPSEEKLIHLYTAFDAYVPSAGKYTAIVSLAVAKKISSQKVYWIESAEFAFEVFDPARPVS